MLPRSANKDPPPGADVSVGIGSGPPKEQSDEATPGGRSLLICCHAILTMRPTACPRRQVRPGPCCETAAQALPASICDPLTNFNEN